MSRKFEKELDKITKAFAKESKKEELKQSILILFEKFNAGLLKDEVIDRSHISDRQTEMF